MLGERRALEPGVSVVILSGDARAVGYDYLHAALPCFAGLARRRG